MADDRDTIPHDVVTALGRVARQLMELVMEQREEIKQLKEQNGELAQYAIRHLPNGISLDPLPPSSKAGR